MTPTYFLGLGLVGRVHKKVINAIIYFFAMFLLIFVIKFAFSSFSFLFLMKYLISATVYIQTKNVN